MGEKQHITATFTPDSWTGYTDSGSSVSIGSQQGSLSPYDLLLTALGGCLYATFEEVAEKMKITWDHLTLDITGEKRDDPPTTLKTCTITVQASGVSDQKKCERAFGIATRYCSVFQTISKVAEMRYTLNFSS